MAESHSNEPERRPLYCPSAPAERGVAHIFGVVGGTTDAPRVDYLAEPVPLTEELMALTDGVRPEEVYRLTSSSTAISHQADIELDLLNAFQYTMPAFSVTTFVLISDGLPGDFNHDHIVDACGQERPDDAREERVGAVEWQSRLSAPHPRRSAGCEHDGGNH